jgi:twitching motility two-component system response regulator PilH
MRKAKLALIDDDRGFLEEVSEMLESNGYSTVAFNDEDFSVEKLGLARPDVIFLDIRMKGKSGLQISFDINKDPTLKHIPIIAMSAVFVENDVLSMCGIRDRIMKPFNPVEIIDKIESILQVD